jgi:hypothetical protein
MVKRVLILAAIAALAVPSAALAKSGKWSYDGAVATEPESSFSFDVVRKQRGGTKKVKNAAFQNVFAGCGAAGPLQISTPIPDKGTLKKGGKGFKLQAAGPLQSLDVRGKVTSRGKQAYGTLHLRGSFAVDGQTVTCDTGPARTWTATLTSGP